MNNTDVQVKKIVNEVIESIREVTDPKSMREAGDYMADLIRIRTRLGYGVESTGAKKQKLKSLKDETKKLRKQARKLGLLSELTTPSKSNLTFSGQLLDSLKVKMTKQGELVVGPSGYRNQLTRQEARDLGQLSRLSGEILITNNIHLANSLAKRGFVFNNLSDLEFKKITNFFNDGLTSAITRRLHNK